jgi:outer membrane lipoprotein carrier protein
MDFVKCSRRRLRETIELGLGLALFCVGAAGAAAQQAVASPQSPGDAALERFLEDVQTLKADFRQQLWSADGKLLDESSGTFALRRPDRFRWDYREPMQQLIVADGDKLWMYDEELAQVTVSPLDRTAGSPAMLLSGGEAVRDSFDVEDSYESGGLAWIKLRPKLTGTDFSSVLIGFDDGLPRQLELVDGLQQTTRIVFSNVAVNDKLDDALFRFEPPRGVDVIGGDG